MMKENNLKGSSVASASLPDVRILHTKDVAKCPQAKSPRKRTVPKSHLNPNAYPKANANTNTSTNGNGNGNGNGNDTTRIGSQNPSIREKKLSSPKGKTRPAECAKAGAKAPSTIQNQDKGQIESPNKGAPRNGVIPRASSVPYLASQKPSLNLSMAPKKPSLGASMPILKHSPACTCLNASIESWDQRRSSTGEVAVMYRIVVGKGKNTRMWQVYRRYTEFEALHKSLEQVIPERVYSQLKLPAKRGLRKYIEKDSTQNKAAALNTYLDTLLRYPITRDHILTRRFLEAYEKQEEDDFIEQAVNLGKSLPTYHMSKLYTEYLHPRPLARPTSCKGMDNKGYGNTLAAAVAAATNPRIRNLRLEARVDLLDKKVNEPTKDSEGAGRKPGGRL